MECLRIKIKPQTAFSSPILGETLFGQLCWAIYWKDGENVLLDYLKDYSQSPFMVVSDAFPHDYLPMPTIPSTMMNIPEGVDRKILKRIKWVPLSLVRDKEPLVNWMTKTESLFSKKEKECEDSFDKFLTQFDTTHNSIRRDTSTTGTGEGFSPYTESNVVYSPKVNLDIYVILNAISKEKIIDLLEIVGLEGYGRNASNGLGKFTVEESEIFEIKHTSCFLLTLSSCDLSCMENKEVYYRMKTHFGRHGSILARAGNPFTKPIILAERGALISTKEAQGIGFIGRGILNISPIQSTAVHQGYSPVIPI